MAAKPTAREIRASVEKTREDAHVVAKEFDMDAFVQGFKPAEFECSLYRRADLMPEIETLEGEINALEADEKRGVKTTYAQGSDLAAKVRRYNELATELEDSRFTFRFRPLRKGESVALIKEMADAGIDLHDNFQVAAHGMARTCLTVQLTPEKWLELCDQVGEVAFTQLYRQWDRATKSGGAPSAPFSPKSSPGHTTV